MGRKKNQKNRIVYSTDPDFDLGWDDEEQMAPVAPAQQMLRIRLDRLKGNKRATVVYDFQGPAEELKALGKRLKDKCGCGGTAKNGEILLQGDFRDKVGNELTALGYRYKMVGG